ncbi:YEATS domain-containing protein 2 isoform X3 [Latimeria chalumnae]|uniref:YEATS domain-containing protein 2 isoform X3 n=1 Tax=Latimeria chalumnae TaxID=7897 RepID=UPI00313C93F5
MSGIKRTIEDKDPDYEEISVVLHKRHKAVEQSARDATVQKIEAIIREQFIVEMKSKEHEIEVIDQRLAEARRRMDKLRACIVANYYASAGQPKAPEGGKLYDSTVFNHPAIKKFLESPSRSSSPGNQRSETPSANQSETESVSRESEYLLDKEGDGVSKEESQSCKPETRPGRNTGQDTFGVSAQQRTDQRSTSLLTSEDPLLLYVKKTIVVGNVSKYIPPDKREENDQSTHKWMVYVRGSRKEPTIDHFVKKVWFFLHPSYKPNDLVEVSEPPFHLTRRGWGEFPVRVQVHFKDPRNKRIDIIHNLKLDRTYTGLQTLGAETMVDVELHRHTLGEDYLPNPSSSSFSTALQPSSNQTPAPEARIAPVPDWTASPAKLPQVSTTGTLGEKGFPVKIEMGRPSSLLVQPSLDRTPSKPATTQKVTLGSHGNSAFQPITASCKIVPQGQVPNPAESPGKSFQPITMSCKIVSGSPISTPSHSPLPRTPTSTPVHMKQGPSGAVLNNPYIIVDKPGHVVGVPSANTGSPASKMPSHSQAVQGTRSPVPKIHGSSFIASTVKEDAMFAAMPPLCPIGSHSKVQSPKSVPGGLGGFTKVIIKQEPGEGSHQQPSVTAATSQQPVQQFVTVKGGHMIAVSPQKQAGGGGEGSTQSKVVGIPVGSALQSAVKQAVAISSGQILVAKPGSSASKVLGQKQVIAQGVAKAIVSGASGTIVAQPIQTVTKAQISSGAQKSGSVMATLQLPATNLANLANLPPGTKLYLTTNSKNPSGKGKLLLIPQGAILRAASNAGQQSGASSAGSGAPQASSSGLPQHLTYTSYILKQTPQGTFLVGQPSPQSSGKQLTASSVTPGASASGTSALSGQQHQHALRITSGQKAAVLAQVVPSGQASSVKLSEGVVKSALVASHLSKPGTTTLRVAGGVITASTTATVSHPANGVKAQQLEGPGSNTNALPVPLVKPVAGQQQQPHPHPPPTLLAHGQGTASGAAKGLSSVVLSGPSTGTSSNVMEGKPLTTTSSGTLKVQAPPSTSQQAILTIPASQLKQLGVTAPSGGVQTILMPVSKVLQPHVTSKALAAATAVASEPSTSAGDGSVLNLNLVTPPSSRVKTEPGTVGQNCNTVPPSASNATVKLEQGPEKAHDTLNTDYLENIHHLLTAVVKKVPLLVPEKTEDSNPFCAVSLDQYYSWNIGKRRAAEWQRAIAMRRIMQEVIERVPRFGNIGLLKVKHIVKWCRCRGYTPPDPEAIRNEEDSIEDMLTQIDSEPEFPLSYTSSSVLCQTLEEMQRFLRTEPESEEEVDIVGTVEAAKLKIKKEREEEDEEVKFFLGTSAASEFVRNAAQEIGISLQPVEMEKNIYAPVVEEMIVKASEQFMGDMLREALAIAFQKVPRNRIPKEITAMNVHQAICSVPVCDFLTNKFMGISVEEGQGD